MRILISSQYIVDHIEAGTTPYVSRIRWPFIRHFLLPAA